MRHVDPPLVVSLILVLALSCSPLTASPPSQAPPPFIAHESDSLSLSPLPKRSNQVVHQTIGEAVENLPLGFEANIGQIDSAIKFTSRSPCFKLFLTSEGTTMIFKKDSRQNCRESSTLRMRFLHHRAEMQLFGEEKRATNVNYFTGGRPEKWHSGVPVYSRVRCRNAYDGVDILYYWSRGNLEYDFILAAGADPDSIRLAFECADDVAIDDNGDLVLQTSLGEIRQHRPTVYQWINGLRKEIVGQYTLDGKHEIGFRVAAHDATKPLIIDPVLSYSTFLGGGTFDEPHAVSTDFAGNIYLIGETESNDFPLASPNQSAGGGVDVFIAKVNPATNTLVYSTYLGGDNWDEGSGIAVDSSGNAYVTGTSRSVNFPTTPGISRSGTGTENNVFVAKLDATGSLLYSILIGGSKDDRSGGIALDKEGNAYVTGGTSSPDFPTTPDALQPDLSSHNCVVSDAFVFKLNPSGTKLIYSTYLGGPCTDTGNRIAVDAEGNAYVAGAAGPQFPTTQGAYNETGGGVLDAFVAKLNPAGSRLVYSTYLPGEMSVYDTAVDNAGNSYVTGTVGRGFVTTKGAFQTASRGAYESFVLKLNASGSDLVYSTYLGGSGNDFSRSIAVDSGGNAYVTGSTDSLDFPLAGPLQDRPGGGSVARTTDSGTSWEFFNRGEPNTFISGLAIDGTTPSILYASSFSNGVFKSTNGGGSWNPINTGLTQRGVNAIAIDPHTNSTIYAATYSGVFKSTDGGSHWETVGLANAFVSSLVIDPTNASTLYSGATFKDSDIHGVFKSTDGGRSWSTTGLYDKYITTLTIDSLLTSTLYAGTYSSYLSSRSFSIQGALPPLPTGVWKTTDGGGSWHRTSLANVYPLAIVVDPTKSSTVYTATNREVFKSTDGGGSWNAINNGLTTSIQALVIDPENSNTLYAGASANGVVAGVSIGGGVFKSTDGGSSWNATGLTRLSVGALAITRSSPSTVLAGTHGSGDNAFVAKLNARGSALVYSTYLGGNNYDSGTGIAVDSAANVYVVGYSGSPDFPRANALQTNLKGIANSFIAKISFLPRISGVSIFNNDLIVRGEGFDDDAEILVNGERQKSHNDASNPTTILIGKKTAKKLPHGEIVTIQVRNSDNTLSENFSFVVPTSSGL